MLTSAGSDDTMRVLDTVTGRFSRIDPVPKDSQSKPFKYAIISHTWAPEGEQSYKQLRDIQKRLAPSGSDLDDEFITVPLPDPTPNDRASNVLNDHKVSSKLREACRVARTNGYRYLWADWCCIDKSSSSELSESINSMYQWYALADVCYVFLPDVPADEDHMAQDSRFRNCLWFTRGWTLQELIAPLKVLFLAKDWKEIGSKVSLGDLITEITNIDYDALLRIEPLETFSVAQRFSWAADRKTTMVEDRAYSLLGILDINMPTMYGEGERAFRRLQEEIMRRTPDQTLFAWTKYKLPLSLSRTLPYNPETTSLEPLHLDYESSPRLSLLAPSLDAFSQCEPIQTLSHDDVLRRLHLTPNDLPARHYDFTSYGIRVHLPVIHFETSQYFPPGILTATAVSKECPPFSQWYLVILGYEHRDFPGCLLGRICYIQPSGISVRLLHSGYMNHGEAMDPTSSDLLPVSLQTIKRLRDDSPNHISPITLHIPQPPRRDEGANIRARDRPHETINLVLPKKNRKALSARGYTVTLRGPDNANTTTHLVTLALPAYTITIDYQHALNTESSGSQKLDIKAFVATSRGARRAGQTGESQGDAAWTDFQVRQRAWNKFLGIRDIHLEVPMGWTLSLGLEFYTTDHYLLSIELNLTSSLPLEVTRRR